MAAGAAPGWASIASDPDTATTTMAGAEAALYGQVVPYEDGGPGRAARRLEDGPVPSTAVAPPPAVREAPTPAWTVGHGRLVGAAAAVPPCRAAVNATFAGRAKAAVSDGTAAPSGSGACGTAAPLAAPPGEADSVPTAATRAKVGVGAEPAPRPARPALWARPTPRPVAAALAAVGPLLTPSRPRLRSGFAHGVRLVIARSPGGSTAATRRVLRWLARRVPVLGLLQAAR